MPVISAKEAGSRNALAFLDTLAWAEGTSTSPHTWDGGYDVIVAGVDLTPDDGVDDAPDTFSDYSDHPAVLVQVNRKGLASTAAGRYQVLLRFWRAYKALLNLPDFSPLSQDRLAMRILKECRALDDVHAGRIEAALGKCRRIWASLPGAGYNQPERPMEKLLQVYAAAGGTLATYQ